MKQQHNGTQSYPDIETVIHEQILILLLSYLEILVVTDPYACLLELSNQIVIEIDILEISYYELDPLESIFLSLWLITSYISLIGL